jgi:hypothetical protein
VDTLIVGDVHGCADELRRLLDAAPARRVVLVGDLYTKGPDPVGVWRLVRDRGLEAVLGNHDARLIEVMQGRRPGDAEGRRCVKALDREDPGWRAHLLSLPLWLTEVGGFTVVHAGLHPSGSLDRTSRAMALSLRRFPEGSKEAPLWHAQYDGEQSVVFGHDARGGLVRREREGRPWVVGLDTGCVYGGQLTGWLPGPDRLVQVPAARVYQAITSSRSGSAT